MLIISPNQFLEELKTGNSKSLSISSNSSRPEIITDSEYLGNSLPSSPEITNDKPGRKSKDIPEELELGTTPVIEDAIILENHTYDNFRKPHGANIPPEVKPLIGALAKVNGIAKTAEAFGVSKDTVGNLSNDKHSNEVVKHVKAQVLENIKTKSLEKIEECIDFLAIVKSIPNRELVAMAESLSRIHKNVTPQIESGGIGTQFIFYVPERQNKIEDYEIIDADL